MSISCTTLATGDWVDWVDLKDSRIRVWRLRYGLGPFRVRYVRASDDGRRQLVTLEYNGGFPLRRFNPAGQAIDLQLFDSALLAKVLRDPKEESGSVVRP